MVGVALNLFSIPSGSEVGILLPKQANSAKQFKLECNYTRNWKVYLFLNTKVLIFCVEFRELSHLTRDLSQAEKKITVFTS